MNTDRRLIEHKVSVLLVDDQPLIGETVGRMLAGEPDIEFSYCKDACRALQEAQRTQPTVILQDLVMPDVDGLSIVRTFRQNEATREIPMIVLSSKEEPIIKAEAFALGANDYIVKLPDRLELLARIRHHSKGYINLLQRNEAHQALVQSQRVLANDLAQAAKYVRSLLPEKLTKGSIQADWRFLPSAQLGGDTFGYGRIDDDHFAFYLIDVSGHGVGPALLSVSVLNALRSQSLPQTDFTQPGQVLAALNRAFQMEQQNGLYFTIWYGVYHEPSRRFSYCGGGHPPALLSTGPSAEDAEMRALESRGMIIGADLNAEYLTESCTIDKFATLLLFSDGVFEIARPDGTYWSFHEFVEFMSQSPAPGDSRMDRLMQHARSLSGNVEFKDDFSIVEVRFNP